VKTFLWITEVVLLIIEVILLRWFGLILSIAVGVIWAVALAAKKEDILVYAATQAGSSKKEVEELHSRLWRKGGPFRVLGPIRTAQLISFISQRGRSLHEIEDMAMPLALLWVVHRPDLEHLVDRVDRLLRLGSEPASNAMRLADTLTAATQKSAETFDEMLIALLAVYGDSESGITQSGGIV
jgi:hypothetical protein